MPSPNTPTLANFLPNQDLIDLGLPTGNLDFHRGKLKISPQLPLRLIKNFIAQGNISRQARMKVYKNRNQKAYLKLLKQRLCPSSSDGLAARAIKITEPRETPQGTFTHCCRIDFLGISASNLTDLGANIVPESVASDLGRVFDSAPELNSKGIFVKIRFLLVYPYSAYALSRMQAENTRNRASMQDPRYFRNLDILEPIDETSFRESELLRSQRNMLHQVQEWVDGHNWSMNSVNKVEIRFVPVSVNSCVLILNDTVFSDTYLLAKDRRESHQCVHFSPLVVVEKEKNRPAFEAYLDHFRYLWDLDVTLTCKDATFYTKGKPKTLAKYRPPATVTFREKADRIQERTGTSDEQIARWTFTAQQLLSRFTMEPRPTPSSHAIFIACSWEEELDNNTNPNEAAKHLASFLDQDFGRERKDKALLSVLVMEGTPGEFLSRQIYSRLEEATLGMVLLTADFRSRGTHYTKPNIYHELGYLMRKLGPAKVALVVEDKTVVPSNVKDLVRIEFKKNRLALCYFQIIDWIARNCGINSSEIHQAIDNHTNRLQQMVLEGSLSTTANKKAQERLENLKKSFAV